jgi:hypothetical protein
MTRESDTHRNGRDNLLARFMSGAVPKAFAQLFRPNPGRQLSYIGKKHRKQLIRDTTDKMRAELNMPPVRWGRL